jgi:multicomponent K+:H+ antiporter subunit D
VSHWVVAPIVLPAMMAAAMVLVMRYHLFLQRIFALVSAVSLVAIAFAQALQASRGTITVYELGDWPAPFGIVVVADRLSTLMILLTSLLAFAVVLYTIGSGWDRRGRHFHPLFQFQLMGVMGAFLTGDAFNLFVFFEVLLIASYGLMIHAGGTTRLRAGVQYVAYNLLGSTLFLFALGTIYAVTGTLNMADIAERVAALPDTETALIRVGATLLLLVFAIKAAVLPLHFWLPASYSEAPAPVAALFAIMTKVGAYAILRMYTLAFPADLAAVEGLFSAILMPAALLTLTVGMIGVLGARRLERVVAYSVVGSMGTLLIAIALFTHEATVAALYYIIHSTFAAAALFLVVDLVSRGRGTDGCAVESAPPIPLNGLVAALFFGAAIAMAGMPPLSGFVGKLLVMDAARASGLIWWIWAVILVTSLVAIVGFARAGSTLFWKTEPLPPPGAATAPPGEVPVEAEAAPPGSPGAVPARPAALPFVAVGLLMAGLVGATILAGPLMGYLTATADQLYAPDAYVRAVLGEDGE